MNLEDGEVFRLDGLLQFQIALEALRHVDADLVLRNLLSTTVEVYEEIGHSDNTQRLTICIPGEQGAAFKHSVCSGLETILGDANTPNDLFIAAGGLHEILTKPSQR